MCSSWGEVKQSAATWHFGSKCNIKFDVTRALETAGHLFSQLFHSYNTSG